MICTNCQKRNADARRRNVNGKEITLYLCPECYAKLYPDSDADFFTSFMGNVGGRKDKACPSCGTTLGSFRRKGLLGCAECYRVFRSELIPSVRYIQGKIYHEGKSPSADAEANYSLVREQEALKPQLERMLREGDFEGAERLKERLLEINRKLFRSGRVK